jgi:hypothetical protein
MRRQPSGVRGGGEETFHGYTESEALRRCLEQKQSSMTRSANQEQEIESFKVKSFKPGTLETAFMEHA